MEKNDKIYKNNLSNQRSEFNKTFLDNSRLYRKTLSDQTSRFTKEMLEEKVKLATSQQVAKQKASDPFYKFKAFSNNLREMPNAYVFKVEVPEHEKDNVRVYVNNNTIIFTGSRKFEDEVDAKSRSIATSTYQSFREEINLDRPVKEKNLFSNYKNGILEVVIPKF